MRNVAILGVSLLVLGTTGCTTSYWNNRGNDLADFVDIGITYTKEPRLAVYAGFQSILSVGYADVDGGLLGLGFAKIGNQPMRNRAAGVVITGVEQYAIGDAYDPADPASPGERGAGLGLLYHETPHTAMEFLQCPKFIHLGWIGVNVNCKIGELFDFIAGWTTLDIGGDDGGRRAAKYDHMKGIAGTRESD